MQGRQHLRQPVKIVEVPKRAIAPHIVEIAHKGRAIHWHEYLVSPRPPSRWFWIAGMKGDFWRH